MNTPQDNGAFYHLSLLWVCLSHQHLESAKRVELHYSYLAEVCNHICIFTAKHSTPSVRFVTTLECVIENTKLPICTFLCFLIA